MAIALWFYDACIPMNAFNSPYYQQAIGKIASMGHGYQGPSYHALRVNLLKDAKKQVELIVENLRSKWAEFGCTIMGDGWKDNRQRSLINFLVYCPSGISFIKSVDASDFESNAEYLCNLFSEIVEIVGPSNVVHMVTDNASNYKAADRLLSEKYPTISWSPCAAHCLNLIMKDIGKMTHVKNIITLASRVTVYVYNRKWILSWLRKRPGWREILHPAETRFGTNFIVLKNLHDLKQHFEALVTSSVYKRELKNEKGKEVKQIVLDGKFWNNSLIIVRIMGPIMRLLRICDSDEKPSLGYVYEGMWRVVNGIKELLSYKKRSYDPVDYETIDKVEFWIVDEEQEGELDYDELEEMTEEEFPKIGEDGPSQSSKKDTNIVQLDDENDLDDINLESYEIGDKDDEDEDEDEEWLR
ncbi:uncharacterized protein LOC113780291 [Coffea eugenioides]|uniref:uncharacterized protein LOC113780291 n=1 Tax=Coffea eugenioides TaxID=49369 RepID=UPI000F60923D|nr:uncharacterized protein LOC113780291 [Coffea eugenioides]